MRNLEILDGMFEKFGLMSLSKLIMNMAIQRKGKKVKFLDVGAGNAMLGKDLSAMTDLFGKPIVEYHGVDLQEHEFVDANGNKKKVLPIDIQRESLPKNQYDIIISSYVFQYLPDKLRALENMINALTVGGVLYVAPVGSFKVDSTIYHVRGLNNLGIEEEVNTDFLRVLKSCPNISVNLTTDGALAIKRVKEGPANFSYDYLGNSMLVLDHAFEDLEQGQISNVFEVMSHYRYNPKRKPKW